MMKSFVCAVPDCLCMLGLAAPAQAPTPACPSKLITLIVPYTAGGSGDIRARNIGERLSKAVGLPVVVENRAGAGAVVGARSSVKSPPDAYTIGMGNLAPLAVNASRRWPRPASRATNRRAPSRSKARRLRSSRACHGS